MHYCKCVFHCLYKTHFNDFQWCLYHVHTPYIVNSQLIVVLSCTCDMTSSDQLSPIVIGCVGLVGILLSFSAGRSRVGPNTVARLWRDILFTLSLSAILETKRERAGRQEIKMISFYQPIIALDFFKWMFQKQWILTTVLYIMFSIIHQ